jgi:uncharacterized linocin/CFP29 family protein
MVRLFREDIMATPATSSTATSPASKNNRGKDQIHWSDGVWKALDLAVVHEMMWTRIGAKFLPTFHVDKRQTTVASDRVTPPTGVRGGDPAYSIDEGDTNRIQEYWVQFRMSVAQVDKEEHEESALPSADPVQHPKLHAVDSAAAEHHHVTHSHRASTGVSLAMRTANVLAQAEDLVIFNGQNATANSPLFNALIVQALDTNLQRNLDLGLLNIRPVPVGAPPANTPSITLPPSQVIPVHPAAAAAGVNPPRYSDNTLDAIARGVSILQGFGHYEHYALVLHTIPYADLHQSLANTLIQTVEPVSHLVKAGIYGTGTLPPFDGMNAGLPTQFLDANSNPLAFNAVPNWAWGAANRVLYTGVLISLSGNTMDLVRGQMDDNLDVSVTFNQRDANEQYRFRVVERFCLRLKDPTAVVLLLFVDA